jgi:hypothetical protein
MIPKRRPKEFKEFMMFDSTHCAGCKDFDTCKVEHDAWVEAGQKIPAPMTAEDLQELKALKHNMVSGMLKARYKVGDTVVVRTDLVPERTYGNNSFVENMVPAMGNSYKVTKVNPYGNYILEGAPTRDIAPDLALMLALQGRLQDTVSYHFTEEMIDHDKTMALDLARQTVEEVAADKANKTEG